ncbi:uncharacterized protein LOC108093704 [Drosophila ficusphila]|uniref:uncharacterized protein LOC108093704 n=1 Tax=Drosophila ficusphila TaxID=30025 RepID=UPI0007E65263|nr:uncharacterized protein LOC108093704 [Drosophila ficusphila]
MGPSLMILLRLILAMYFISEVSRSVFQRLKTENTFQAVSLVEFKNIKCESMDKEFCTFEYCLLKSVNRTYKYFSLRANLLKVPVTNCKVNGALYQRHNGYKPFLYNITVDACKFVSNQKTNRVAEFLFNSFKRFTNLNHSCPYDHDIVLDKVTIGSVNNFLTKALPFPDGDYMLETDWYTNGIRRVVFKVFMSLRN